MPFDHNTQLIVLTMAAIAILVLLIAWAKLHALLALMLAALAVGIGSGTEWGGVFSITVLIFVLGLDMLI